MSSEPTCAIWNTKAGGGSRDINQGLLTIRDSARAGGSYTIDITIADRLIPSLEEGIKARLTTHLVQSRRSGTPIPHIGPGEVSEAQSRPRRPAHDRALALLDYLTRNTPTVGERVRIDIAAGEALAWSESTQPEEVQFLAKYLVDLGLIRTVPINRHLLDCWVLVEGYSRIEDIEHVSKPNHAFVAMWFDASMDEAYSEGIQPAITDAGYEPCRIDQKLYLGKIDDEIIREIRRSRFMVADFTQGKEGNRGSVYYEAGFARGIEIPVISTCRKDQAPMIAFDTRQFSTHIMGESEGASRTTGEQDRCAYW